MPGSPTRQAQTPALPQGAQRPHDPVHTGSRGPSWGTADATTMQPPEPWLPALGLGPERSPPAPGWGARSLTALRVTEHRLGCRLRTQTRWEAACTLPPLKGDREAKGQAAGGWAPTPPPPPTRPRPTSAQRVLLPEPRPHSREQSSSTYQQSPANNSNPPRPKSNPSRPACLPPQS